MASPEVASLLSALGLPENKLKETLKNATVTALLTAAAQHVKDITLPKGCGMLIYHAATKIKPQIAHRLSFVTQYIATEKLDSTVRIDAALEYLLAHVSDNNVNVGEFENACGIGVVVTPEQVEQSVESKLSKFRDELLEKRYRFNTGLIMQAVRTDLPWADGKAVKNEVDVQVLDLLGPKTEADLAPVSKADKKIKTPAPASKKNDNAEKENHVNESDSAPTIHDMMKKVNFHAPGDNYKTDGYVVTPNTKKLLAAHLKVVGGNARTRFPPEPNGILHIGHAKAININFGYAAAHGGVCYLRYDDTNPEKEEEKFFVGIKDMVDWLGYKPAAVTHSSDNFQQLYKWAVELIKKGFAYVCHQTTDEMRGFNPKPSPWRDRPIEESLQLFEDMKNGKIEEGKATLRMKTTLEEGKMDPVAYRIKFTAHHRTGNKWCIYPTYDYTHCLCDSIENITHSLCTKEFQSRRSSYYWLCNALDIYCPVQWEYGRLNVNYTVVSKRKIAKLITEGIVKDWDDPRLYTLSALRRRGYPSEAINNFCAALGVTGALGAVDPAMLEASVRDVLNKVAPRVLVVLEPLKVTIKNFATCGVSKVSAPDFPNEPERGSRSIAFDQIVYIEESDFKETPEKGYKRLSPNQTVGLRHTGFVLKLSEIVRDKTGKVTELICTAENPSDPAFKPKAFIQWVSFPMDVEVRLYEPLFIHKNPEDPAVVPGGFLTDCNMNSLKIVNAMADASLINAKVFDKFQFERIGFFSLDPDTTPEKMVFNRTVTLKEDAGKV
ncbi:glutaminyl-tRNA synthetase isoform X2 [Arctopsyche grandis]|uniref:glutaminyl-tRNA synthetase isoform X2 n=1 Tax=Arctopsyche grandis TaxID=121162 RepID=UPI00406D6E0D